MQKKWKKTLKYWKFRKVSWYYEYLISEFNHELDLHLFVIELFTLDVPSSLLFCNIMQISKQIYKNILSLIVYNYIN